MTALRSANDSSEQIEIVSRRVGHAMVLVVSGEIDLATAPIVELELLSAEGSHDLVALDLSKTSFMDSTGLHVITEASLRLRQRGGRLFIGEGPAQVSHLFELTGLSDHLDLVRDHTELERRCTWGSGPGPGPDAHAD